jgi:hypothetical protein
MARRRRTMLTTPSPSSAAQRLSIDQGYGRTSRRYRIPGTDEAYDSVTSILSAIGKPALINWAAKSRAGTGDGSRRQSARGPPPRCPRMSRLAYLATLQTRLGKEKAHQRELANAHDSGRSAVESLGNGGQRHGAKRSSRVSNRRVFMASQKRRIQSLFSSLFVRTVVLLTISCVTYDSQLTNEIAGGPDHARRSITR